MAIITVLNNHHHRSQSRSNPKLRKLWLQPVKLQKFIFRKAMTDVNLVVVSSNVAGTGNNNNAAVMGNNAVTNLVVVAGLRPVDVAVEILMKTILRKQVNTLNTILDILVLQQQRLL